MRHKAFSKALLKGNAYASKELSDRAYGRLKERIAVDVGPYRDMSNEDIQARIGAGTGIMRDSGASSPKATILRQKILNLNWLRGINFGARPSARDCL